MNATFGLSWKAKTKINIVNVDVLNALHFDLFELFFSLSHWQLSLAFSSFSWLIIPHFWLILCHAPSSAPFSSTFMHNKQHVQLKYFGTKMPIDINIFQFLMKCLQVNTQYCVCNVYYLPFSVLYAFSLFPNIFNKNSVKIMTHVINYFHIHRLDLILNSKYENKQKQ